MVIFIVIILFCNVYVHQESSSEQLIASSVQVEGRNSEEIVLTSLFVGAQMESTRLLPMTQRVLSIPPPDYIYNPTVPTISLGSSDFNAMIVSNDGNTLFVALLRFSSNSIMQIFNISDLASPDKISEISFILPQDLGCSYLYQQCAVQLILSDDGNTIFVLISTMLQIIDVSNTSSPTLIRSYDIPNRSLNEWFTSVILSPDGKSLFLFSTSQLITINISDLLSPQALPVFQLPSNDFSNFILNEELSYILALQNNDNYLAINISNITNLATLGTGSLSSGSSSISQLIFSSNSDILYAFYGDVPEQLIIFNMSEIQNPTQVTSMTSNILFQIVTLSLNGNYLFCQTSGEIQPYDVSNPFSPLALPNIDILNRVSSYTIAPDNKTLFVINDISQLTIFELYFDIDIEQSFDVQFPVLDTYNYTDLTDQTDSADSQGNTPIVGGVMAPDGNSMYVVCRNNDVIFLNVSDPTSISPIRTINSPITVSDLAVSPDGETLYIIGGTHVYAYDISDGSESYSDSIELNGSIYALELSSDGNVAFVTYLDSSDDEWVLEITNISVHSQPVTISNTLFEEDSDSTCIPTLSADEQTLFITGGTFRVYNISNLSSPTSLVNVQIPKQELLYYVLSSDGKTLFIYGQMTDGLVPNYYLNILNISSLHIPLLITSVEIPSEYSGIPSNQIAVLSKDDKTLYLATGGLMIFDVSNLFSPKLLGVYSNTQALTVSLSPDENTVFLVDQFIGLIAINIKPEYGVYMLQDDFPLGGTYPVSLNIVKKNNNDTYDAASLTYKFTAVSLYSIASLLAPKVSYSALPTWITSSIDQGILIFTPSSIPQIQNYTMSVAFSTQVDNTTFIGIGPIGSTSQSNDLMISLMGCGYLDSNSYLTTNFDPSQTLSLNSQYLPYESSIRSNLAKYYVQMLTTFSASSSLSLTLPTLSSLSSTKRNIVVNTLSLYPLTLNITLSTGKGGFQPQFVNTNYFLPPSFSENQSIILIAGPLLDINEVLSQLIIFVNNSQSCNGNITILDELNPALYQFVPNISDYFLISEPPFLNATYFQSQVAKVSIQTGDQFIISCDPSTFKDYQNQSLTLSLRMQDGTLQVPDWLSIKGYAIIGSPPEQLTDRELNMVMIVSNEYQSTKEPFTLSIGISWAYAFKLVSSLAGAFFTAIGLVVYASSIYNVLFKRSYRYKKEFTIVAGQEITSETIYPVAFIQEEIAESKLIVNHLKKKVQKETHSSSNKTIAAYFYDVKARRLDLDKLNSAIQEISDQISNSPQARLGLYNSESTTTKELINRLVIAEITLKLLDLNSEKSTKAIFNTLKGEFLKFVTLAECSEDGICVFSAEKDKLAKIIQTHKIVSVPRLKPKKSKVEIELTESTASSNESSTFDTSQMLTSALNSESHISEQPASSILNDFNIDLLADAIEAFAFKQQNLDIQTIDVDIAVLEKAPQDNSIFQFLKRFLKRDLQLVVFSKKAQKIGYGLEYEILTKSLRVYGNASEYIKGKTIVIQIMNNRGKILREMWLHGKSANGLL